MDVKLLEHELRHLTVLGTADAHTDPSKIFRANFGETGFQPSVSPAPTADLDLHLSKREVKIVMEHHQVIVTNLQIGHRLGHGLTGAIHIGLWFQ